MGSAFDKIVVLWTLCALTTLLCGVFLGVLYHLLGQQIFVAGALHTLVVSVFVSFRFTALDGTSLAVATNNTLTTWPGPLQRLAYWVYFVTAVVPFYFFYGPCFLPYEFAILCLDHSPLRVRDSISKTAKATCYGRYTAWMAGLGDDHLATAFLPLRWRPIWGLVALQYRLGRHLPMPLSINVVYTGRPRTTWLDGVVREAVVGADAVAQVVILGAGLDTRFHRLGLPAAVKKFEVDAPGTQAYKLRCLKAAGVDTSAVTHVPVNFETQSWLDELKKQGFDPKRPVLLVWEGVSMYLSPSAIDAMMKSFGACAQGSLLAFDVWRRFSKTMRGPDDDDAPEEKAADKTFFERIVTQVSFLVGERLTFGIDADEATFLAEPSPVRKWMEGKYAFKVKEDLNCNAIDAKFLSVDGRYVARNGPGPRFVVVARK